MTELYPRMEALAETEGWKVYAFCVLCLGRVRAAESAAFQSFLYMGESKPPLSQEEEKALLYAWAYRAIGDAKLKKGHKPLSRKQLEEALGTPVSDTIWKFMQFPLQKKAVLYLRHIAGLSVKAIGQILKIPPAKAEKLLKTEESFATDAFEEDMNVFVPKTAWLSQLGDDVLLRYQERSVPFENRLLRLRSRIDRAVPYAALAAALLCAAAVIYSSYIAASLPPS